MVGEARQGSCRTLAHSMNTSKSVKNRKKSMAEWSAVLAMYSLVEVEARSKQAPDTTVVFKIRSRHTPPTSRPNVPTSTLVKKSKDGSNLTFS